MRQLPVFGVHAFLYVTLGMSACAPEHASLSLPDAASASDAASVSDAAGASDAAKRSDAASASDAAKLSDAARRDRDAGDDASEELTLEQRVWQATDVDHSCTRDDDCSLFFVSASCSGVCTSAALSRKGAVDAYAILTRVERELCHDEAEAARIDREHGRSGDRPACSGPLSGPTMKLRCVDASCEVSYGACANGCELGPDGRCSGDAACAGCPFFVRESDDTPCTQLGLQCEYGSGCSTTFADCEQGEQGARWSVYYTACSRR